MCWSCCCSVSAPATPPPLQPSTRYIQVSAGAKSPSNGSRPVSASSKRKELSEATKKEFETLHKKKQSITEMPYFTGIPEEINEKEIAISEKGISYYEHVDRVGISRRIILAIGDPLYERKPHELMLCCSSKTQQIVAVSENLTALTTYVSRQLLGKKLVNWVSPSDKSELEALFKASVQNSKRASSIKVLATQFGMHSSFPRPSVELLAQALNLSLIPPLIILVHEYLPPPPFPASIIISSNAFVCRVRVIKSLLPPPKIVVTSPKASSHSDEISNLLPPRRILTQRRTPIRMQRNATDTLQPLAIREQSPQSSGTSSPSGPSGTQQNSGPNSPQNTSMPAPSAQVIVPQTLHLPISRHSPNAGMAMPTNRPITAGLGHKDNL